MADGKEQQVTEPPQVSDSCLLCLAKGNLTQLKDTRGGYRASVWDVGALTMVSTRWLQAHTRRHLPVLMLAHWGAKRPEKTCVCSPAHHSCVCFFSNPTAQAPVTLAQDALSLRGTHGKEWL